MIILQILLKSLKVKTFWVATILLYVFVLLLIAYMVYQPEAYVALDMNKINEKNVNFFYVFLSNVWLIIRDYSLGLITFGIYAEFSLIQNILSLGVIANSLVMNNYIFLFYKMILHGIFEIFGMVLSVTSILYFFYKIISNLPNVIKRKVRIGQVVMEALNFLGATLIIQLILFIVAGVIEMLISLIKVV